MVPNFALSLSFDGIALLRRMPSGWARLDEVALDTADLDAAMAGLRAQARALDPDGDAVLLVLPDEQVRYLDIADPGSHRPQAARVALDGATPYAVDDLAIDCSVAKGRLMIAAVARETLDEAEGFAVTHRFRPVACASIAPEGAFAGAVYFGQARAWSGRRPVRPDTALKIVPADAEARRPAAAPDAPKDAGPAKGKAAAKAAPAIPKPPEANAPAVPKPPEAKATEPKAAEPKPQAKAAAAPGATGDGTAGDPARVSGAIHKPVASDLPPTPAFSTRRATDDAGPAPATGAPRPERRFKPLVPPRDEAAPAKIPAPPARADSDDMPAAPSDAVRRLRATVAASRKAAEGKAPDPDQKAADTPEAPGAIAAASVAAADAAFRSGLLARVGGDAHPTARAEPLTPAQIADADERRRMTVFGARDSQPVGGKPRFLGVALTGALLLVLALIGFGSVMVRGPQDLPQEVAAIAPDPATADGTPADGTTADNTPADGTPDADDAEPAQDAAPSDPVLPDPEPEPAPESTADLPAPPPDPARALSPDEAAATFAATGIWQRAPDAPRDLPAGGVEDIYIASIDPDVTQFDAVSLPPAPETETGEAIADPGLPPPPDLTFDFDDRGLIRPTPDGALSPDGLRIFEGPPPAVPPLRSEALPGPITDTPPLSQFRDFRPEARPEDLIESSERAIFRGLSREELAAFRPAARPETAPQDTAEAETEADGEDTAEAPQDAASDFASATPRAVAVSLVPAPRPGGLAEAVAQAQRPTPEPGVQTASLAPDPAPAPRPVSPDIPSSAEVARAATIDNAVNLRSLALFGIYGTESNRRALVRLANGRYEKVQIGDRLDGGQVVAITDSQLIYRKGNRSVTLDMPRG